VARLADVWLMWHAGKWRKRGSAEVWQTAIWGDIGCQTFLCVFL